MRRDNHASERDSLCRGLIARQGGSHRSTAVSASKSESRDRETQTERRSRTTAITAPDKQDFDSSQSATVVFAVSGEPLGNAFLQGNKARIVPVSRPTVPSPRATTTTPTITSTPELAPKQHQLQKCRYVFIGKPRRTWRRLVSLPDPELDPPVQKTAKSERESGGAWGPHGPPR